jgi:hypothetical protein
MRKMFKHIGSNTWAKAARTFSEVGIAISRAG